MVASLWFDEEGPSMEVHDWGLKELHISNENFPFNIGFFQFP